MLITDIRPQQRTPQRDSVYVDRRYAFSLDRESTVKLGLRIGLELLPETLERIQGELARRHAMDAALRLLSYRGRSRKEIHDRLRRRGMSEDLIELTCNRLTELGLLNDEHFAEILTRDRIEFARKGSHQIRAELRRKGIAKPLIEQALAQVGNEDDSARALIARTRRRYAGLEPRERCRKLHDLLLRRGFPFDVVSRVLAEEARGAVSEPDA
jgi:regulatory protein